VAGNLETLLKYDQVDVVHLMDDVHNRLTRFRVADKRHLSEEGFQHLFGTSYYPPSVCLPI